MIGLGKLGANRVRRLMAEGPSCEGYDANSASEEKLKNEGVQAHYTKRIGIVDIFSTVSDVHSPHKCRKD